LLADKPAFNTLDLSSQPQKREFARTNRSMLDPLPSEQVKTLLALVTNILKYTHILLSQIDLLYESMNVFKIRWPKIEFTINRLFQREDMETELTHDINNKFKYLPSFQDECSSMFISELKTMALAQAANNLWFHHHTTINLEDVVFAILIPNFESMSHLTKLWYQKDVRNVKKVKNVKTNPSCTISHIDGDILNSETPDGNPSENTDGILSEIPDIFHLIRIRDKYQRKWNNVEKLRIKFPEKDQGARDIQLQLQQNMDIINTLIGQIPNSEISC
jgi:hypothetical protein